MPKKAEQKIISNDPAEDIAPIGPYGAVQYSFAVSDLEKLAAQSKAIKKILSAKDLLAVRPYIAQLRNARLELTVERKALKEGVVAHGKLVDSEAKALINLITPEEERLNAIKSEFEDALATEKQKKFEAEKKRTDAHRATIQIISDTPGTMIQNGAGVAELEAQINDFDYNDLSIFEEFADQAAGALATALSVLKGMLTLAQGQAEQAEIDKANETERKRIIDAAAEVEADRVANEKEANRLTQEKADQEAQIVRDKEAAAKKISDDATAAKQKIIDDKAAAKQKIADDKAKAKAEKKRLADIEKARPDAEKLKVFSDDLRCIAMPELKTPDGSGVVCWIDDDLKALANRIDEAAFQMVNN